MKFPPLPIVRAGAREDDHQSAVIAWVDVVAMQTPEWRWVNASANGGTRPFSRDSSGRTFSRVAEKLKATGVRPGVADLSWPVARGPYHGLYLEMKRPESKAPVHLSDEQIAFLGFATSQGYCAAWANSAPEAVSVLLQYWSRGPFDPSAACLHGPSIVGLGCECCGNLESELARRMKSRRLKLRR